MFEGRCKVCAKASKEKSFAAHPEKLKASQAKWLAANSEKAKAANVKWRAKNPEKMRALQNKWRAAHPERASAATAKWNAAHPEYKRIKDQNRRARKQKNGGVLSKGLAEKLFNLQKGKCPCCGHPLGDDYQLDHAMPLVRGGANEDWNMQLLRKRCNQQKHTKHPVEFMQSRGFLL